MITNQERDFLRNYAAHEFRGEGALVDLGCWLGSSCCALAEGLARNRRVTPGRHLIQAYDRFVWEDWMYYPFLFQGTEFENHFQAGQSFFPECRRLCQDWEAYIRFHPGDLTQLGWSGGAIELLFVDAMKSWELADCIVRDFYPHLLVGRSLVVQQDFWSYHVYWLHLLTYRFREYFEPVVDIPGSPSLVFRYQRQMPPELLKHRYSLEEFEPPEIEAAFAYAESLVAFHKRPMIQLAKVRLYHERGDETGFERALLATSNLLYLFPQPEPLRRQLQFALKDRLNSLRSGLRRHLATWKERLKRRPGTG